MFLISNYINTLLLPSSQFGGRGLHFITFGSDSSILRCAAYHIRSIVSSSLSLHQTKEDSYTGIFFFLGGGGGGGGGNLTSVYMGT